MKIGKLRFPIEIQKLTRVQDPESGQMIETWSYFDKAWANVRGLSGREFLESQAVQAETTYQVTVRYRGDLDTTYRFAHDGNILNIKAVLPDDNRRFLTCMCEVLS